MCEGSWTHARHQTRVEGEVWGPRPAAEHQIIVICPFVFVIGSLGDHCEGLFRAPDLSLTTVLTVRRVRGGV